MRHAAAAVRSLFAYIAVFFTTGVLGSAVIVLAHLRPKSALIDQLPRWWSHTWFKIAGIKLEVEGGERLDTSRSYMVISNHVSNLDVMTDILGVPVPIRFLAKKELFSIPLFAQAMRAYGIVEVDREAGAAIHEQVNRSAQRAIQRTHSLIIYPEGTRSRTSEPRPFKKGAFTIAKSLDLDILPTTLYGTYELWKPGAKLIYSGTVKLVIHEPIPIAEYERADLNELRDQCATLIAETYFKLREEATAESR